MKRIDNETKQRILDTADIVEVVSDFVSLKRRGANYIGLCPFHNERTPSFSVSKAKGICKCFSCGKGGSPVNFIMEHEQMSFNEALRYLAKKYNIEIQEHELTEEERREENAREGMFAANEFAMRYFESILSDTDEGRDVGLAYFRERGINDAAIKRFHLGFSPERGNAFLQAAKAEGFNEQYIVDTGLVARREDGSLYDRFRGRVIYPVFTISGKVVAFGGRTLRNDKKMAKYVNSPESIIYSKSRELYGLYQAKRAIVEKKKCILVEGYMDVISMSQSGIENVVASSGTSLTEGQIRLIHRFTENVTVIYDSDAAGIKASLRGIDMLLADGLNIKVVLLPDGDDPDSFAQSHSTSEVEEYIARHETDFIRFKTRILLDDAANDPVARASVIAEIVKSISVIPDEITRSVYTQECSRMLEIDEKVLLRQIKKQILDRAERRSNEARRDEALNSIKDIVSPSDVSALQPSVAPSAVSATSAKTNITSARKVSDRLEPHERELARLIVKYGLVGMPTINPDGSSATITVLEYIENELNAAGIALSNPDYLNILVASRRLLDECWADDIAAYEAKSLSDREKEWEEGESEIRNTAVDLDEIKKRDKQLQERIDTNHWARIDEYTGLYLVKKLVSATDDRLRIVATDLASSKYKLSKIHSKFSKVETERDRLEELLPRAIFSLKDAIVCKQMDEIRQEMNILVKSSSNSAADKSPDNLNEKPAPNNAAEKSYGNNLDETASPSNNDEITRLMAKLSELNAKHRDLAKILGERVVTPSRSR